MFSLAGSSGRDVAVVSQRPGICGSVCVGRMEVDVGMGIWSESWRVGDRWIWAIADLEMLL